MLIWKKRIKVMSISRTTGDFVRMFDKETKGKIHWGVSSQEKFSRRKPLVQRSALHTEKGSWTGYSRRNWCIISNGSGGGGVFFFFFEFHLPTLEKEYVCTAVSYCFDLLVNLLQEAFPVSSGSN